MNRIVIPLCFVMLVLPGVAQADQAVPDSELTAQLKAFPRLTTTAPKCTKAKVWPGGVDAEACGSSGEPGTLDRIFTKAGQFAGMVRIYFNPSAHTAAACHKLFEAARPDAKKASFRKKYAGELAFYKSKSLVFRVDILDDASVGYQCAVFACDQSKKENGMFNEECAVNVSP